MRRAVPLLILLAACGSKDDSVHPSAASGTASASAAASAKPDAGVTHPGAKLSAAPLPAAVTPESCKQSDSYTQQTMHAVASDLKVPAAQVDQVAKDLAAQFLAQCSQAQWPKFVVDCFEKSPADSTTYQRCIDRLPATLRKAWDAQTDAIFGKAKVDGPKHPAEDGTAPDGGVKFEDLCGTYVAEVARFDDCNGGGVYVPQIEEVIRDARVAEVGGVIPKEKQDVVKKLCDDTLPGLRDVEAKMCPKVQ